MARKAKKRAAAGGRHRVRRSVATLVRRPMRPATTADVSARKAVPNPETDPLSLPSVMEETNGGGSIETGARV